jgi:endoglucanase
MRDAAYRRRTATVCASILGLTIAACGGATLADQASTQTTPGAALPAGATPDSSSRGAMPVSSMPMLRGVSLSSAEFAETSLPGNYGTTYVYPTTDEAAHWLDMGMSVIRLPFRWERLQQAQLADFDAAEQYRLDTLVSFITSKGGYVLVDPHNYARYYGGVIGQDVPATAFADFWSRLASLFKDNDHVIFALMNEPNNMATETWVDDANVAIAAIRKTGATNLILVPGNAWTGAWSWNQSGYGTPNGNALLNIVDPGNNFAIEVHQYLDGNASGSDMANCVSSTIGSERLQDFTSWLTQHGLRGFLGEFAGSTSGTCLAALDDMLKYIEANPAQWLGYTYWAAGPWWGGSTGSIEPQNGQDLPQTQVMQKYLHH